MRFELNESLLALLRAAQAERAMRDRFENEDTFLLDPGMGPAAFLTADGRVLLDFATWDGGPLREATDDEAVGALVVGAKKTGVAELLELIPPPPDGASVCPACDGRRWIAFGHKAGSDEPGRMVCLDCRGRGWRRV